MVVPGLLWELQKMLLVSEHQPVIRPIGVQFEYPAPARIPSRGAKPKIPATLSRRDF